MTADQRATVADRFDKAARLAAAEPVAVVGIGCRFPGNVSGPQQYWDLLASGGDAITEIPPDRWDADAFYDPDPSAPARMTSKWGGFVPDVSGFDADFFGISPREAEAMDPQQRLLLEVAWEALEHAGFPPDRLSGTRAAVMMGVYYTEYQAASAADPAAIDAYCATGNAHSVAVGRIAYLLGLHGPAVAVDTACSSSLVSVHLACQSLRMRESEIALAGGVNLILRPETQLALSKWGMLSPRGRCHSFDADADGFVRGEGCGVVVLKRLTDAVRDGDRVLAVVRGSALNQDGRSNGLTAPNAFAQRDVITRALWSADVPAGSVNLVETHGTGTALGDPIEFDALASIYGQGDGPCAMGAVKTNFGHLEAAAGIAGFIKTVLALQHAQIPQNLHFTTFNPAIDPSDTRLFVPTATTAWPQSDGPRRAGVSSFGLGGTNAHVVVEQGPDVVVGEPVSGSSGVSTLVVSGKSEARVASWAGVLADWLEGVGGEVGLAEVAHSVNHHRSRFVKFASVCARDRVGAVAGLRALASGRSGPGVVGPHRGVCGAGTVFVYSGQGSQWVGMGRRLLVDEPVFAAAVAELEPVFVVEAGFSLQSVLAGGESLVGIDRIQPVLVGVQLALTQLWRSYGVHPDAVIGHSMGEVAAAVVSGALSVAQGLRVIVTRSRLMARLSGRGAMALLELDAAGVEAVIADYPQVGVAVYASPRQTVVAGPPDEVDAVVAVVDGRGLLARRIEVDVASHHRTVDPILGELRAGLAGLVGGVPSIRLISTTGGGGAVFDAEYWVANLRDPVCFTQAVATAAEDHATFIEISPHPLLTHAITDTLESGGKSRDSRVSGTLYRDTDDTLSFHTQLAGVRPPAETATSAGTLVDLPPTPWEHTRFWLTSRPVGQSPPGTHPLLGTHVEMPSGSDHVWQADVGTAVFPWLSDHRVHGQVVMPAAGIAEMALAAGSQALGLPVEAVAVRRLEVEQMLPLGEETHVTTQLSATPDAEVRIELHSRSTVGAWCRHAVAQVDVVNGAATPETPAWSTEGQETVPVSEFYSGLRRTGAHHGPAFAALTRIDRTGSGSAESHIALPDEAGAHPGFHLHPVLLDAALQTLAAAMPPDTVADPGEVTYLPVSIENIRVYSKVGRRARCRAELTSLDERGAGQLGRIVLADEDGTPTAEITGVYLRRVERRTVPLPLAQKVFDTTWRDVAPSVRAPSSARAGSWLMLFDGADTKAAVDRFSATFASSARRVISENLFDEPAVHNAFAEAAADPERPPVGVVVFVGHRGLGDGVIDPDEARDLILSVTGALRALVGGWHGKAPRLWVVSRGGLSVDPGEAGSPAIGALRGLVRVLTYEHPDLQATLVDLDTPNDDTSNDDTPGDDTALAAELATPGNDDVIAWRGHRRLVERLSRASLPARRDEPTVRADSSYVLTGGLGGLGLVVARWLVDKGAGRVILNGRSEPSDEQSCALAALAEHGDVAYVPGDIVVPGVADGLVAAAERTGLPLRGIMHGAAVLDDGLATSVTRDSLDRVWAPKAVGALRLHEASASRPLDWWVGFSSVASLLGSPGQAAYACANAWLDALVTWRRAAGLPASTINWGQWSEVGLARAMSFGALDPISPAEGIEALETLLGGDLSRAGVARLRLDRAAAAFPEIKNVGYFADMVAESDEMSTGGDWPGPQALEELDAADVAPVVIDRLRERTSAIMGYPDPSAVDVDQPLTEIGMDSLMAVRIRNTARADFGVEPPVALLLQGATLRDLAADLVGQLGRGEHDPHAGPDGLRDRAEQRARQRAHARQQAASRRKAGHRA